MAEPSQYTSPPLHQWYVGAARLPLPDGGRGRPMMGWAQPHHAASGVALPLFARTVVFAPAVGPPLTLVLVDFSSISGVLRTKVEEALSQGPAAHLCGAGLMLMATHTHSGPGGYLDGLLFQVINPFDAAFVEEAARAIAATIERAWQHREPATVQLGADEIPCYEPIAFNRSLAPHHANPELEGQRLQPDEAVDRKLVLVWALDIHGQPLAAVSFFGCHGTCVHADHSLIHPDHKGIAALRLEEKLARREEPPFVALFAQACAGDVSPNFKPSAARRVTTGAWDDDFETAEQVAAAQVRSAARVMACPPALIAAQTSAAFQAVEFTRAPVHPELAGGTVGRQTGPGVLGFAMMQGTAEGPGPFWPMRGAQARWAAARSAAARRKVPDGAGESYSAVHAGKLPALEMRPPQEGKALAALPILWFRHVPAITPYAIALRKTLREADPTAPWLDHALPIQLVRLGPLAIAALPFEPTTQAGRRIRADLERALAAMGISRVVVAGYANAYAGYLTTAEEYAAQHYEGGFTLFGQWSLDAARTALLGLAHHLATGAADPSEYFSFG